MPARSALRSPAVAALALACILGPPGCEGAGSAGEAEHTARDRTDVVPTREAGEATGTARAPIPGAVDVAARDSAGIRILQLSHTPTELAAAPDDEVSSTVAPDLRVGESEPWLGAATDVAGLGDGRFAVLDGMERRVLVFDSLGELEAMHGGEGAGPGEYEAPWALAAAGDHLVVWQDRPTSTFTVLAEDGTVAATGSAEVDGDWSRPQYRHPAADDHGTLATTAEDVSRRLVAYGERGFLHMLQPNEFANPDWSDPVSYPAPPADLIRYDLEARVQDTVATLVGAPALAGEVLGRETILYEQPQFSARPVFATGDGWIALGHGDSIGVVVRGLDGDTVLTLRWPDRRPRVSVADRIESMRFTVLYRTFRQRSVMELVRGWSPAERRKGLRVDALENWSYAEVAPTVTAAYGAGSCLFLSGFSSTDWGDGTSLTWVVVDVEEGRLRGVLRLRKPEVEPFEIEELRAEGAPVRAFDEGHAYTAFRDNDGVPLVERYPLPIDCRREAG